MKSYFQRLGDWGGKLAGLHRKVVTLFWGGKSPRDSKGNTTATGKKSGQD